MACDASMDDTQVRRSTLPSRKTVARKTAEGEAVRRHRIASRDDLAVFLSLAASISIVVSAAGAMWIWSNVLESRATVTAEEGFDKP